MNKTQARKVIGGTTKTTKMGKDGRGKHIESYSISATHCSTGSKLRKVKGSVCEKCYALKGRYCFQKNRKATLNRWNITNEQMDNASYREAFKVLLKDAKYFRWFDSGDLINLNHLEVIIKIAKENPHVKFWLPTKEVNIIKNFDGEIPSNLVIRVSSFMVDQKPFKGFANTSTVIKKSKPIGKLCQAIGGTCGSCKDCWDSSVKNISYKQH